MAFFLHRHAYIRKPYKSDSWLSAPDNWALTDTEILKAVACVHPHSILGIRFGKATRYGVLDIDCGSKYHTRAELKKLLKVLFDAGLTVSIYRSSESGGYHVYIYFEEPINSIELRRELCNLLSLHNFELGKGQLEVFPNRTNSSLGLGCRLPLQDGFAWVNGNTLEIDEERVQLSPMQAVARFLLDTKDSNSYESFRNFKEYIRQLQEIKTRLIVQSQETCSSNVVPIRKDREVIHSQNSDTVRLVADIFHRLPPGIIASNWWKGRQYHLHGLTGPSQRADAIECVGHYLFYGDPSRDLSAIGYGFEQERQWAIEEFLRAHHNGHSKDISRGCQDAFGQAERAANWLPPHKKGLDKKQYSPQRPISWIRENANRKSDARKRITDALHSIKREKRAFTTVELQTAARCSRETLYRHGDIWRQDYEDLASDFFAICTDEYNCAVGGGSQETSPPAASSFSDMPPGRLAARRIAYELSLRAERHRKNKQKTVLPSSERSETEWTKKFDAVIAAQVLEPSIAQIKAFLTVLAVHLSLAPTYECQQFAQNQIALARERLKMLSQSIPLTVKPP